MDMNEANKKMHPIETQWHYAAMTEAGFVSTTPPQQGFVRTYVYIHPVSKREIHVTTGSQADYWNDKTSKEGGYWADLAQHLKAI